MYHLCKILEEIFNNDDEFMQYTTTSGYIDITEVADIIMFVDRDGKTHKDITKCLKYDGTYILIKEYYKNVFLWKQKSIGLPSVCPN